MVEIQRDHEATENSSGKSLHHIARYAVERPGPGADKQLLDIVTDDGSIYRFSQLQPGDPFNFEPGHRSHGARMSRSGRLPGVVEAILNDELTDEEDEADPGWMY